jgi:RNA polymerase sigma factor (TIGR02999 family)
MRSTTAESKKRQANPSPASERLPSTIYAELRRIAQRLMRGEHAGHTLQTTALVHEAFLRLAGKHLSPMQSTHVRAAYAQAMRHILVDHARRKQARKRGGERLKVALDERLVSSPGEADLLDLNELLEKLSELDPAQAQLVELRIFGGMTVAEAAAEMGLSKRSAEREWTAARAWLRRELAAAEGE